MIVNVSVLGSTSQKKNIGVIQIVGGTHDGDIFGLPDRATKALSWSTTAAIANSFARKSSNRLVVGKASAAK